MIQEETNLIVADNSGAKRVRCIRVLGGHERRYAGQMAGGVLRPGDEMVVLPSGLRTRVTGVHSHDGWLEEAFPPRSVSVSLADDLDVGRGDMLVGAGGHLPFVSQELAATVCWMHEEPLAAGKRYAIKHTTRTARAVVTAVHDRLSMDDLHPEAAERLNLNEIGQIALKTTTPLVVDPYTANRVTGRFILIDEANNATAGAGMVIG